MHGQHLPRIQVDGVKMGSCKPGCRCILVLVIIIFISLDHTLAAADNESDLVREAVTNLANDPPDNEGASTPDSQSAIKEKIAVADRDDNTEPEHTHHTDTNANVEGKPVNPKIDPPNNKGAHSSDSHSATREEPTDGHTYVDKVDHHTHTNTNVEENHERQKYGASQKLEPNRQDENSKDVKDSSHAGLSQKTISTPGQRERDAAVKAKGDIRDNSGLSSNAHDVKGILNLAPSDFGVVGLNKLFAIIGERLQHLLEQTKMSQVALDASKSLERKVESLNVIQQALPSLRIEITELTKRLGDETKAQNSKYDDLKRIVHSTSNSGKLLETKLTGALSVIEGKHLELENQVKAKDAELVGSVEALEEKSSSNILFLRKSMEDLKVEMMKQSEDLLIRLSSASKKLKDELDEKIDELEDSLKKLVLEVQGSCEKSVSDLNEEFNTVKEELKSNIQSMDNKITRLTHQQEKDTLEINAKVSNLEQSLTNMTNSMADALKRDLSLKAEQLIASINETDVKHIELRDNYDRQVVTTGNDMKNLEEGFKETISKLEKQLTDNIENIEKIHKQWKDEVDEKMSSINKSIHDLDKSLKEKEEMFRKMEEEAKARFSDRMKEVDAKIASSVSELKELIDKQQKLLNLIHANTFNKEAVIWAALVLTFLVITNMVITYAIIRYNSDKLSGGSKPGTDTSRFTLSGNSKDIINLVPSNPPLQPSICIVSYGKDRVSFNMNVVNSVVSLLTGSTKSRLQVLPHLIDNHTNIPELPRCKLIIMCIEFSERHVIIEEQGIGLGDIRLTTYNAVQKMGANLVILYTRDPESRQLSQGKLYNQEIYCVRSQEQLVKLNQAGRFLSLFDQLTDFQKQGLSRTITECCKV